jgi:hypothetical protein
MLVSSVDKKIVELRDTKQAAIYDGLKLDVNTYGMHTALRDVISYHESCSFMTGLQKALDEGAQGGNAQKILRLRTIMLSLQNEIAPIAVIPADKRNSAQNEQYARLKDRLDKVNDSLKSLETQQ